MSFSHQNFRQRRVIIKARFVKFAGAGFRKASAHLNYVQRDGVSQKGEQANELSDMKIFTRDLMAQAEKI